jgi:hypothetical protein
MPSAHRSSPEYESRKDFKSRRRRLFVRWLFAVTPARRVGLEFLLWMLGLFVAGLALGLLVHFLR